MGATSKPSKLDKLKAQRDIYETKALQAMERHHYDEAAKYLGLVNLYNYKIGAETLRQWKERGF
jgi:hypothetical protein